VAYFFEPQPPYMFKIVPLINVMQLSLSSQNFTGSTMGTTTVNLQGVFSHFCG